MSFRSKTNIILIVILVLLIFLVVVGMFYTLHTLDESFSENMSDNKNNDKPEKQELSESIEIEDNERKLIIRVTDFSKISFVEILDENKNRIQILNDGHPEASIDKRKYSKITIREWSNGGVSSYRVIVF